MTGPPRPPCIRIIEHIIEFRAWREDLARLLEGHDVFLVGVHCDLAEVDRRGRDRGDRRIGEGRARTGVPAGWRERGVGPVTGVRRDVRYPLASH
jgi:chloramphenicol 3-O-phosphotransferase